MKTFKVNGKEYTARAFDFNLICDLEDMGISMEDFNRKPMSMVRAYFGLCLNGDTVKAGHEMEQHLINGGKFDDIVAAMQTQMEESDFFRALNQTEETETQPSKTTKRTKTSKTENA